MSGHTFCDAIGKEMFCNKLSKFKSQRISFQLITLRKNVTYGTFPEYSQHYNNPKHHMTSYIRFNIYILNTNNKNGSKRSLLQIIMSH